MLLARLVWGNDSINLRQDTAVAGCQGCGEKAMAKGEQIPSGGWYDDNPCPARTGTCRGCDRTIHKLPGDKGTFFCSTRCRNRVYGKRYRKRHPKPKKPAPLIQCVICKNNFVADRSDAKTCSPACRQKRSREQRTARVTDK
jgi:hypothetical protein